mmetsp:Transcript_46803/g.134816  ORF Transcript_46803/g.134816 Transcript_46803/m.134816 type:complete len:365 (+) Transcript_46803:1433-2527(+)
MRIQLWRQVVRSLPADRDDDACGLLEMADLEHGFQRQLLEVEAVALVVVSGHRLGVTIDNHGAVARLAEGTNGADTAPIELHGGADAVATRAQNNEGGLVVRPWLLCVKVRARRKQQRRHGCADRRRGEGGVALLRLPLVRQGVRVLVLEPALPEGSVVQVVLVGGQLFAPQRRNIMLVANVSQVEVVGLRRELRRQGVHLLHTCTDLPASAQVQDLRRIAASAERRRDLEVTEAELLASAKQGAAVAAGLECVEAAQASQLLAHRVDRVQLRQEPTVDVGQLIHIGDGLAFVEGLRDRPQAKRPGSLQVHFERVVALAATHAARRPVAHVPTAFEACGAIVHHAHRLLDRLRERAADGHDLAN